MVRKAVVARRVYWPNCQVCQYMKKHQDFKLAIMNTSYFSIGGVETVPQVLKRYNVTIPLQTMYAHFKRHQKDDIERKRYLLKNQIMDEVRTEQILKKKADSPSFIQGIPVDVLGVDDKPEHVVGLEEFVKLGREKVRRGEMPITAANYLTALKIQSDREKSNKDIKVDLFKTMFKGAAPSGTGQHEG